MYDGTLDASSAGAHGRSEEKIYRGQFCLLGEAAHGRRKGYRTVYGDASDEGAHGRSEKRQLRLPGMSRAEFIGKGCRGHLLARDDLCLHGILTIVRTSIELP